MSISRGVITLVFDDGYQHIYERIVPFLNSLHLSAVFAVPLQVDSIEGLPTTPWQTWKIIEKDGHEIAAHGISHTALSKLSANNLQQELVTPAQTLSSSTLIYPGGDYNEHIKIETKKLYSAARSVHFGLETIPPKDPYTLRTWNTTKDNFSVIKANLYALQAVITNRWLIETFHIIDDNAEQSHAISYRDFVRHITFISKLPVEIKTIKQVIHP